VKPAYENVAAAADGIERAMRDAGLWSAQPLPPEKYEFKQAFAMDTMSYEQWLQFVFLVKVRELVGSRGTLPRSSSVGAQAIREFDTVPEASTLVTRLCDFDALIEGRPR
jgi:uncharacterized protein YqcC (DUF446 family)